MCQGRRIYVGLMEYRSGTNPCPPTAHCFSQKKQQVHSGPLQLMQSRLSNALELFGTGDSVRVVAFLNFFTSKKFLLTLRTYVLCAVTYELLIEFLSWFRHCYFSSSTSEITIDYKAFHRTQSLRAPQGTSIGKFQK